VRALQSAGWDVLAAARRSDRLKALADQTGCRWTQLDVTDESSIAQLAKESGPLDLLVNNAGGAKGLDRIEAADPAAWRWMFETNVLGLTLVTKALLPALRQSKDALIVNVGSIAGIEAYPGGAGYTSAKHAVRVITETLRLELLGEPIRISEVAPGAVETEFSLVRFDGDADRAAKVYEGLTPLTAQDVAETIRWIASLPSHVNIDSLVVKPRDQARATLVHRRTT
jgi:NADP-dependent 3-hydroxy acid dehydrogenase YdfG